MYVKSLEGCGATHLGVASSKERAGDHTARLLHRYQLDNIVTAGRWYLHTHTHGNLNNEYILCKSRSL